MESDHSAEGPPPTQEGPPPAIPSTSPPEEESAPPKSPVLAVFAGGRPRGRRRSRTITLQGIRDAMAEEEAARAAVRAASPKSTLEFDALPPREGEGSSSTGGTQSRSCSSENDGSESKDGSIMLEKAAKRSIPWALAANPSVTAKVAKKSMPSSPSIGPRVPTLVAKRSRPNSSSTGHNATSVKRSRPSSPTTGSN